MSATPVSTLQDWFENVWNRGDESAIDRMLHHEGIVHGLTAPGSEPIRGPEAFKPFHRRFRSAFPDMTIDVVHEMTRGDLTVAHCRVTGTHTGEGLGIAATNRRVEFTGFTLVRVADGLLVEGWNCFDFLGMYQQLGVSLDLPAG